jgi:hypothetical protein
MLTAAPFTGAAVFISGCHFPSQIEAFTLSAIGVATIMA